MIRGVFSSILIFLAVMRTITGAVDGLGSGVDDGRWLQQLYNSTNGNAWSDRCRNGWNMSAGANPCNEVWHGVICDLHQRVYWVAAIGCNASGTLPDFDNRTGAMWGLLHVYLHSNGIEGTLPESWDGMSNLSKLWLHNNRLSGTIPESWANVAANISVSFNFLGGGLPSGWFPVNIARSRFGIHRRTVQLPRLSLCEVGQLAVELVADQDPIWNIAAVSTHELRLRRWEALSASGILVRRLPSWLLLPECLLQHTVSPGNVQPQHWGVQREQCVFDVPCRSDIESYRTKLESFMQHFRPAC